MKAKKKSYTIDVNPEMTTKLRKENYNINDIMGSVLHHHQRSQVTQ